MSKTTLKERIKNKVESLKKPKVKQAIFENSLGKIHSDFTVRVTNDKIIIEDEETKLKFTPNEFGEVVIAKEGDKLTIFIEKEKRG